MKEKRPIPLLFIISAILALLSGGLYIAYGFYPVLADTVNSTVGFAYRMIMAKISGLVPFSIAEFIIFAAIPLVILLFIFLNKNAVKGNRYFIRAVCYILCIPLVLFSFFTVSLEPGYKGKSLYEKLSMDETEVTADTLYKAAMVAASTAKSLADEVNFSIDGASVMPFSHDEMCEKLSAAYEKTAKEYPFINSFSSTVKPLMISNIMTYTHLSGVYTYYTGEANLNTNYPEYINVFTAAHEMAHQRGVSKEDEANFIAFLVCARSDDPYIKYCGYANIYSYLSDALYETDETLYLSAYYSLDKRIKGEYAAYGEFFDKYRENKASDISNAINESYLKRRGTEGVVSYGMVVKYAVAYFD